MTGEEGGDGSDAHESALDELRPSGEVPEEEGDAPVSRPAATQSSSTTSSETSSEAAARAPSSRTTQAGAALLLDVTELRDPEPGKLENTPPESGPRSLYPLSLDLSGFSEPDDDQQDAWTMDRVERSTPVPAVDSEGVVTATLPPLPGLSDVDVETPQSGLAREASESERGSSRIGREHSSGAADDAQAALQLVDRSSRPPARALDLATEMAERYALGDFTGALTAAELLLGREPDHAGARQYAASSRERLEQLYTSRLGSLTGVARVIVPENDVRWLGLDHRAGFVLSRIDGRYTLEELLDVSGMPRLETLKTLAELVSLRAIEIV